MVKDLERALEEQEPTLFIFCGFPYAGKSHVISKFSARSNVQVVSIDSIFERRGFSWDNNILPNKNEWDEIFMEAKRDIQKYVEGNFHVFYDSTNHTQASRNDLRQFAESISVNTKVVFVKVSESVVWERRARIEETRERSVVQEGLVRSVLENFEEPQSAEGVIVIQNG